MRKIAGFILLSVVSAFCQIWIDGYRYRAELILPETSDSFPVEQAGFLKINCPAKEDGSDIRITDESGKEIDFFLARSGPGNYYELFFPAKRKKLFLFFGNPEAVAFDSRYRPERGVLLELYKLQDTRVDSWERCKKTIENTVRKENFVGATLRKNIFDATNPITGTGHFLRVYTGYFYLSKKETISFGTTSSGASFILVDGKLVASRPGSRWVEGFIRDEFSGTIELQQGLHKLVYYHFEFPGWGYSVCAMKRESDRKFEIISDDFFLPVVEAKISHIEKNNSPVCASFQWKNVAYLYREKWEFITFQFTDCSESKNEIVYWQWDFGDGQTSNERNPVHTYFLKKTYNVSLTVKDSKGNSDKTTMKVQVEQDYGTLSLPSRTRNQYLDEFNKFNLSSLPDQEILTLAEIYNNYDEQENEFNCYSEILKRNIDRHLWLKVAFDAGALATKIKKYSEATAIYQSILREADLPQAKIKLARVYLETEQFKMAENLFQEIDSDTRIDQKFKKAARIGLGDIARCRGDRNSAEKFYESVIEETNIETKVGAYNHLVSFYLKRADFPAAIAKLMQWEEDVPTDKLKGDWSIFYARTYCGLKDYDRALKEIETFLKVSDVNNPYYCQAIYWKGEIYLAKEEKEKARTIFLEITEKFPETQTAKMAKSRLQEIEK